MDPKAIRAIENFGLLELPKELCDKLQWHPADIIEFYTHKGLIVLRLSKESRGFEQGVCYKDENAIPCNFCGRCGMLRRLELEVRLPSLSPIIP